MEQLETLAHEVANGDFRGCAVKGSIGFYFYGQLTEAEKRYILTHHKTLKEYIKVTDGGDLIQSNTLDFKETTRTLKSTLDNAIRQEEQKEGSGI